MATVVTQEKLDRINELARKAKTTGLTPEEIKERDILRKEYLAGFRRNFEAELQKIQIVEADGSITPVTKKKSAFDDSKKN
ncbi:MAG: DUF896 domain-containing protein [Firmicutes bacterium]|nr:DUF896 domain-containing protein [Bacillota bacterium]